MKHFDLISFGQKLILIGSTYRSKKNKKIKSNGETIFLKIDATEKIDNTRHHNPSKLAYKSKPG